MLCLSVGAYLIQKEIPFNLLAIGEVIRFSFLHANANRKKDDSHTRYMIQSDARLEILMEKNRLADEKLGRLERELDEDEGEEWKKK